MAYFRLCMDNICTCFAHTGSSLGINFCVLVEYLHCKTDTHTYIAVAVQKFGLIEVKGLDHAEVSPSSNSLIYDNIV